MTRRSFHVTQVMLVVAFLFSQAGSATAAQYFVATNGVDSRSCSQASNIATPRQTIAIAARCLSAGDTLLVRGGVYPDPIVDVPSGTSWSSKVRIAAYSGETVWVSPSSTQYVVYLAAAQRYIEFDGINLDGTRTNSGTVKIEGWSGGNAHHIRMQNAELIGNSFGGSIVLITAQIQSTVGGNEFINLTVHRSGSSLVDAYAFYIGSGDNLIDGCDISDVNGAGVHIYNGYGIAPSNNTIRNNTVHDVLLSVDPRTWGIIVAGGDNNKVYNNVVYNIGVPGYGNAGIMISGSSSNTGIFNNTVYGSLSAGIYVIGGVNAQVINNIAYLNGGGNYINVATNTYASNNLTTDPGFVNAGGRDFRLSSTSQAIDRGVYVGDVQFDKAGVARPQGYAYDVGAYESGGSAPPAQGASSTPAPPTGSGASSDGTMVPGVSAIIDNSLAAWTLGSGLQVLRNGVQAGGGYGTQILWSGGSIYVRGDDSNWWRWTGSNWTLYSSNAPGGGAAVGGSGAAITGNGGGGATTVSPSGTRVPPTQIVDGSLAVWTIGSNYEVLRNGSQVAGGYASQILWYQSVIYVLGDDGNWWRFNGSTYVSYGPNAPG